MIIYKITNKINGKVYIGQTIRSLDDRWQQHLRNAKNGVQTHFYHAIRKYGEENFIPEIICSANTKEELNVLETYYIQEYDAIDLGYNMIDGGNNNVMFIPEVKAHHKQVVSSPEIREHISKGMKKYRTEHPFTDEQRKIFSERAKGNVNGTGNPSHSVACYCVIDGMRRDFKNYKEAGIWWYMKDKPFGDNYSQATYQRKIIDCIEKGECRFQRKDKTYVYITKKDIEWYRKDGDVE